MRKVIVNTTPLIALCHVGQLDVLRKMYGEIFIPQAVYQYNVPYKVDTQAKGIA